MNPNLPNPQPHEQALSFDDLEIEQQPTDAPTELPLASSGSLKDKVLAQIKPEKTISISTPAVPPPAPEMKSTGPTTFSEPAITYPDTKPVADSAPTQVPTEPTASSKIAVVPELPPLPPPLPEAAKPEVKVEVQAEQLPEQPLETPTSQKAATAVATPATTPVTAPAQAIEKTEVRRQIESILQNELSDMYVHMEPAERVAFSKAANETASKLEILVSQFKATAKEVLRLIRAWLTKIPRVNQYFLEQASKIKTDEVLEVQRQEKKRSRLIH